MTEVTDFKKLIIAAPFGNYLGRGWATRTLGTFTIRRRPPGDPEDPVRGGRLWRILKTVRYNPFKRSWRNKIGLRNPGISSLFKIEDGEPVPKRDYSQDIISIHGFTPTEWTHLAIAAANLNPVAIELNLSCPNVEQLEYPIRDFRYAMIGLYINPNPYKGRLIVKLPPPGYGLERIAEAVQHDHSDVIFHCCNTIPSPKGGISGKPLLDLSIQGVQHLRSKFPYNKIIGGGGITCLDDAKRFLTIGANHVAIASCLFFPWNAFFRMKRMANILECE